MNIKVTCMHVHESVFLLYSVSLTKVSEYILIYVVHIYSFDLYCTLPVHLPCCKSLWISKPAIHGVSLSKTYKWESFLLQMLLSFFWSTNWVFHITIIKYFLLYWWWNKILLIHICQCLASVCWVGVGHQLLRWLWCWAHAFSSHGICCRLIVFWRKRCSGCHWIMHVMCTGLIASICQAFDSAL